jgi:hypothetical protein
MLKADNFEEDRQNSRVFYAGRLILGLGGLGLGL